MGGFIPDSYIVVCGVFSSGVHRREIKIDTREADLNETQRVRLADGYKPVGHPLYGRLPRWSGYGPGEIAEFPAIEAAALIAAGAAEAV